MFCYGNDETYSTDQDPWFVLLFDKNRLRIRMCFLRVLVIHGGSDVLTRIVLFGIHCLEISIILSVMLLAYLLVSSSCKEFQFVVKAFSLNRS